MVNAEICLLYKQNHDYKSKTVLLRNPPQIKLLPSLIMKHSKVKDQHHCYASRAAISCVIIEQGIFGHTHACRERVQFDVRKLSKLGANL